MPTRRQERVAKRIIRETVEALRNLKRVDLGFITVTGCEVSPDLRQATVFVSVFGDDGERERSLRLVRRNAARLRGIIGRPLGLKMTPELKFEIDESLATADRIGRLIRDARSTDANPHPLTPEEIEAMKAAGRQGGREARGGKGRPPGAEAPPPDPFEAVRREVEDELLPDDPAWRPIDLDAPPDYG